MYLSAYQVQPSYILIKFPWFFCSFSHVNQIFRIFISAVLYPVFMVHSNLSTKNPTGKNKFWTFKAGDLIKKDGIFLQICITRTQKHAFFSSQVVSYYR